MAENIFKYSYTKAGVHAKTISKEIEAAAVPGFKCIEFQFPDKLTVKASEPITGTNKSDLDSLVVAHQGENLDEYKQKKIDQIKKRTEELIDAGFSYDSKNFSLSDDDRSNYIGIKSMLALLADPIRITALDNTSYNLAKANVDTFLGSALTVYQGHKDSGAALKTQVISASNHSEVDAVEDNR